MTGWFQSLFAGGPVPELERALGFASARHRLLLDNLANADTPGYRRRDLERTEFEESLRGAWEGRPPGAANPPSQRGLLRHDGNNVDLEMELAALGKNASFHNQMAALLRKSFEQIRIAVAERPTAT